MFSTKLNYKLYILAFLDPQPVTQCYRYTVIAMFDSDLRRLCVTLFMISPYM